MKTKHLSLGMEVSNLNFHTSCKVLGKDKGVRNERDRISCRTRATRLERGRIHTSRAKPVDQKLVAIGSGRSYSFGNISDGEKRSSNTSIACAKSANEWDLDNGKVETSRGFDSLGDCSTRQRSQNWDKKSDIYILRSDGFSCSRETVTCA